LTKTQRRKARAERTAARHAQNGSKKPTEDSETVGAKTYKNNVINQEGDFNPPEPRNDLAAILAMVPRVRKVADRDTNSVQTKIIWMKTNTNAEEEVNDDEGPVVRRIRGQTTATRSSRRRPPPSSEDEPEDEEPDDDEQSEEPALYAGPSMNKAPYTVCLKAQFTAPFMTPFTNYQVMTVARHTIHFLQTSDRDEIGHMPLVLPYVDTDFDSLAEEVKGNIIDIFESVGRIHAFFETKANALNRLKGQKDANDQVVTGRSDSAGYTQRSPTLRLFPLVYKGCGELHADKVKIAFILKRGIGLITYRAASMCKRVA
jgi:hypothetical protein